MEDCSPSVEEVSWFVFIAITIPQARLLTKRADFSLSWFWDPRWCLPYRRRPPQGPKAAHELRLAKGLKQPPWCPPASPAAAELGGPLTLPFPCLVFMIHVMYGFVLRIESHISLKKSLKAAKENAGRGIKVDRWLCKGVFEMPAETACWRGLSLLLMPTSTTWAVSETPCISNRQTILKVWGTGGMVRRLRASTAPPEDLS